MSITAISFYWGNDTPSFVNWRSRLATAPDTPMCIVIHGGHFTGGVHPPNQFVPEIISPLPCSPALVRHTLLIVYFFKELISVIGSLDKCHTSVLNALIIKSHQMMLHAKYECFSPYGLSQEDFKRFPSLILCNIMCAWAEPKYDPKGIILTIFIKGH